MPFLPAVIPQFHLTDKPFLTGTTGHCYPLQSIWRLDSIPVAPVIFCILKIVMEYEQIHIVNDVEIALPRHVIGLQDCSFHDRYILLLPTEGSLQTFEVPCGQRDLHHWHKDGSSLQRALRY